MSTWVNYHSHSSFCDGSEPPEKYLKEAIQQKMPAYGFSAHASIPFNTNWCIPDNRFLEYLTEINRLKEVYKQAIEVYLGLEIDFIPEIAGRNRHLNSQAELDYFIGSVHFIESFSNGERWNIDTSLILFQQGLMEIYNNDIRKAALRFWEITRQMIEEDRPDIIGHLDKIKMFNISGNYFSESESWYRDQIDLTIDKIKQAGCIVEVNTRGYYRYGQPDLYPSGWIIKRLNQRGIPLIISSDAHQSQEITKGMDYAYLKLKEAGVKELIALRQGKWKMFPFSTNGLSFE